MDPYLMAETNWWETLSMIFLVCLMMKWVLMLLWIFISIGEGQLGLIWLCSFIEESKYSKNYLKQKYMKIKRMYQSSFLRLVMEKQYIPRKPVICWMVLTRKWSTSTKSTAKHIQKTEIIIDSGPWVTSTKISMMVEIPKGISSGWKYWNFIYFKRGLLWWLNR